MLSFPPAAESTGEFVLEGPTITFDRFEPHKPGKYPTVLILHGSDGPFLYAAGYRELARGLVAQGYAAYLLHYLDRTGSVPPVEHSSIPQSFGQWMEAVDEGIHHIAGLPAVDSGRMGLVGISLGSYLALAVAPRNTRVRAVVEFFGGLSAPFEQSAGKMPPVLILHGSADTTVSVSEAHKLAALLSQRQIPHEMKIYKGQGHGFQGPALWDSALRMVGFLNKYLKR
ncbi:MAG: dienelactone hydrolase family protein [Chloroflexi bacterium]|nr:dienelactone hydrolase family protein [Chloroflexota bacterium]